jgi:hypothetical protein
MSEMRVAVNDVFGCGHRGFARRVYMRAKCLELLSAVAFGLDNQAARPNQVGMTFTPFDVWRIAQAEQIMRCELGKPMTLAQSPDALASIAQSSPRQFGCRPSESGPMEPFKQ